MSDSEYTALTQALYDRIFKLLEGVEANLDKPLDPNNE